MRIAKIKRSRVLLAATAIIATAGVGTALAAITLPQTSGSVDLLSQSNVTITGNGPNSESGTSVAAVGDVNGDGYGDLAIGAPEETVGTNGDGAAYVVFGAAEPTNVDLGSLGKAGFAIEGSGIERLGRSIAAAGDVNKDGKADVIVGAPEAADGTNTGAAYVVFGGATGTVDVATPGTWGFTISSSSGSLGETVDGAGDVNGDGYEDVIVGNPGRTEAAVIFGSASTATRDTASLGIGGFLIDGAGGQFGHGVAGVGDVNNDGKADVLVGNRDNSPAGAAYVIFGANDSTDIDTASLGARGVSISGASTPGLGTSADAAGDVNGDGVADMVVGANGDESGAGSAYVVFGPVTSNVDLSALGSGGFAISGGDSGFAATVAGGGDVNGDGNDDVVVGSAQAGPVARARSGASYVVFGKSSNSAVDIDSLGVGAGIVIDGAAADDHSGSSVGIGDINGDVRADVVIGAYGVDNSPDSEDGSSYVVFGFGQSSATFVDTTFALNPGAFSVTPKITNTGKPSFSSPKALPGGLSLDSATGAISGTVPEEVAVSSLAASSGTRDIALDDLVGTQTTTLTFTAPPDALCNPQPALSPKPTPKDAIELTLRQVTINQRIAQAAIRRANAMQSWLDDGIETRDICGYSIGVRDFEGGVTTAIGARHAGEAANPRPIEIAEASSKKAKFTLTERQLLINQRIYQAALRRVRALQARVAGELTGGDLKDGNISLGKINQSIVVSGAAAPAASIAPSTTEIPDRTGGNPDKVAVSRSQLVINQRIAQKAVDEANTLRRSLGIGLTGDNFKDGTVAAYDLSAGVAP